MMQRTPNAMPTVYPGLRYRDANAAIDWLERVFGFERHLIAPGEGDAIAHAELRFGTGVVMLGSLQPGEEPDTGRFKGPYLYVADVKAHYERAKAQGAEITLEYEEKHYGGAGYSCRDCEGNEWSFGSYVPEPAFPIYGAVPYLACKDAAGAIDFYGRAFGAAEVGQRYEGEDGRVGHAELSIGPVLLYLSDEHPEFGVVSPQEGAGHSASIVLDVADCDAVFQRAVEAGATAEREPGDQPYGRMAVVVDPYGHRWMLNGPVANG